MTRSELEEILSKDNTMSEMSDSSVLIGLNIIEKYIPGFHIEPAHDILYCADINEIIKAGLTSEDAEELRKQNWMIDSSNDCLAVFT